MRTAAFIAGFVVIAGLAAAAAYASDATIVRDCANCPDLIVVPPGPFEMGLQPAAAKGQAVKARATPRHTVTIRAAFLIGVIEVTRDQFAAFAKATGYRSEGGCTTYDATERTFAESRTHNWQDPGFAQTGRDPVVCVDWRDANAYVNWLSKQTGKHYRLPSEAEWEYAARAGTQLSLYWGNGDACLFANVADITNLKIRESQNPNQDVFPCADGYTFTAPVATFKPNAFGLYDVIGNVWEWTQDCFNPTYDGAPANGAPWLSGDCDRRMARGGSWTSPARHVTVTFRDPDAATYRSSYLGFRVVRDR